MIKHGALLFICLIIPLLVRADVTTEIWRSVYYDAIPNKKGITKRYCQEHTPGTFTGRVNDQLKHGTITENGIHMDHFTFSQEIKNGIYLMHGTAIIQGVKHHKKWQDKVYYYVYKLKPLGITRGVWSTNDCKGLYLGSVVSNS